MRIPPYHWWRTVFYLIPAITLYTIVLGAASLVSSLFDRRGHFAHKCARAWSWLILKTTGVRVHVEGLERITPGTTYVFVSNHQSIYDTPVIFASLPYQLRIIAKESLAMFPVLGWHLRRGGHLFVDRRHPDRGGILRQWRALVSDGLSLIIYAEGTRSRDGRVGRFKGGSFLLAIQAGLPIVPVAVIGTRQVMPKGRLRTEPADVTLVVHDPIVPPAIDAPTPRDAKALADQVRAIVAAAVDQRQEPERVYQRINIRLPENRRTMHVTAIIAAGGLGRRFGGAQPKQLLAVGGRAILERTVAAFLSHPAIDALVVALPQGLVDDPPAYLLQTAKPLRIVTGGERRQVSVANAFDAADAASDIIVIHDAARPFVSADLIARTIAAAAESGAAVAAVGSRDTVKLALRPPSDVEGRQAQDEREAAHSPDVWVNQTLPRETIFLAQTPQAFRRGVLAAALDAAARQPLEATDEATLVERAGGPVRLVDGEATNIKITTPEDLPIAEAIARSAGAVARPARTGRAGTGYDLHRLVAGRPLVLGGVTIPSDRGALGHSDADVVCHAVTDAVLGAACLGDIGRLFPDSDPRWKDASSLDLLQRAVALVRAAGFEVGNVDVTVILEAPKIREHVDAMRAGVAGALGIDAARVSIKGKTNEGVDAVGRGEAIAAHAIVLIRAI